MARNESKEESVALRGEEYWCFISYGHADNGAEDRCWATWLQQEIVRYDVPAKLVGTTNDRGELIPKKIYPVFRDETSLAANADLPQAIIKALDNTKVLVVLCSPRAVKSTYVGGEIKYFKRCHDKKPILAAIIDGETESVDGTLWDSDQECFPAPLRHPLLSDGTIDDSKIEIPLTANFRLPDKSQGYTSSEAYELVLHRSNKLSKSEPHEKAEVYRSQLQLMKLKILGGILGVTLDQLQHFDSDHQLKLAKEKTTELRRWILLVSAVGALAIVAAIFWWFQKLEAERQSDRNFAVSVAAIAETRLPSEADSAVLLAMAAYRQVDCAETRSSLFAALARRPQLRRSIRVEGLALSRCTRGPEKNSLLVWGKDGLAKIVHFGDGSMNCERVDTSQITNADAQIISVACKPNGSIAAVVGDHVWIRECDGTAWMKVPTDTTGVDPRSVDWQPGGCLLAVGCGDQLRIVDPHKLYVVRTFSIPLDKDGVSIPVETVAWKPGGSAVGAISGKWVILMATDPDVKVEKLDGLSGSDPVNSSPGGTTATYRGEGGDVTRYAKISWKPSHLAWRSGSESVIACAPTAVGDFTIWKPEPPQILAARNIFVRERSRVRWHPDGNRIALGTDYESLDLYDFDLEARSLHSIMSTKTMVSDGEWLGEMFVTLDGTETIRLWSTAIADPLAEISGFRELSTFAWEPGLDGRLAVTNDAGQVSIYNQKRGLLKQEKRQLDLAGCADEILWTTGGDLICFGEKGLRKVVKGKTVERSKWVPQVSFQQAALSPDGNSVLLLLKADSDLSRPDDTIQLRGTSDGNLIAEFDSSQHDFSNPSWHPDAKQSEFIVVEGSRLAMLRLVAGKLKVLQRFARLDKSGEPANSVDFTSPTYSPDGRQVAAVDGGEVIVWDTNTGLVRAEFRAHVDVCTSLAWLGNSRLATGNREDMKVRIWNVSNSELVVTLPGQRFCNQLAFHKPTRTLAMNRQDSEIKLFHVDIRDWEKRAIETVQRNLTEDEWHTYIRTTRACPVMIPKLSGVK